MTNADMFDSAENFARMKNELQWGSSYQRLPTMLEWAGLCDSGDWLRELGEQWTSFDNVNMYADELVDAVFMHHWDGYPIRHMMNDAELDAFDQLPEVLTVYRGCYTVNKWGFCWSLDRSVAERFPHMLRYGGEGRPLLVKGALQKSQIAALKLDRSEAEIVTFVRPKCISISTARKPESWPQPGFPDTRVVQAA